MTDEPIGGPLVLRHWTKGRGGDFWKPDDYDVFSGDRKIGRILALVCRQTNR